MNQVTTLMTVFNGEKYIENALKSLAWQTRKPDRVVVLDDGSTDRTREIVRGFSGLPCECVHNEKNFGYYGNFNQALSYAPSTGFLHIFHQDDILKPQYYERLTAAMAQEPAPSMGYCQAKSYAVTQVPPDANTSASSQSRTRTLSASQFLADRAENKSLPFCSVLIKTGGKPVQTQFRHDFPLYGDTIFWSDLALECGKVIEVDEVLLLNGLHEYTKSPNLRIWILDEWRAMRLIEDKRNAKGVSSWIRDEKMRYRFAARCAIKRKQMSATYPEAGTEVARQARAAVGSFHWLVGLTLARLLGKA